jgi:hypothetical protein
MLRKSSYPEVLQIASNIVEKGSITMNEVLALSDMYFVSAPKGFDKLSLEEILLRTLFLVDGERVTFQNRAIANYVKEKLASFVNKNAKFDQKSNDKA